MWGWLYVQDWGLGDDVTEGSSVCWAVGPVGLTFDGGGCEWGGEDVWVGCGLYELALDLLVGFALKKERNLLSKTSLQNFKWHFGLFKMRFKSLLTVSVILHKYKQLCQRGIMQPIYGMSPDWYDSL